MSKINFSNSDVCMCNYFRGNQKIEVKTEREIFNRGNIFQEIIKNMIGPVPIGSENVNNKIIGTSWRYLIKKEILSKNNIDFPEDVYLSEDLIFCLKFLFEIKTLVLDSDSYYHYEDILNSATRKFKADFRQQQQIVFNEIQKLCFQNTKDRAIVNNLDSLYIEMSISEIVNQVHSENPVSSIERIENIKLICTDEKFNSIIKHLNYKQIKFSRKIIFALSLSRQYWLIYLIYKLYFK